MNCKNCGHLVQGNYCSNCGQSTSVGRLSLHGLMSHIIHDVFQLNKGLFHTVRALSIRPGHTILDYIGGRRKRYYPPLAYILVTSSVYFVISAAIDQPSLFDDAVAGFMNAVEVQGADNADLMARIDMATDYFAYINLLLVPLFSLGTWAAFVGGKKNLMEHLVANAFIGGHQILFYLIFSLINILIKQHDFTQGIAFVVAILYNFWAYGQLFHQWKKLAVYGRLICAYVVFLLTSFLILPVIF